MIARAEGMLARDAEGALTLTLPSDLPEAWERDGVRRQAPPEMGERAWWAGQVLARVPPGHWVECFQASPSALLAGLPPDEWVVVEAWVDGALRFGAPRWLEPLWLRLGATLDEDRGRAMTARRMRLLRAMPKAQAERLAREVLAGRAAYVEPSEVLQELPKPWSVAFGRAWIEHLGRHVKALDPHRVSWPDPWVETLRPAARALPVELAEAVSEALATLPTQGEWHIQRWLEARDALESTLLIRDTIHCEADADERREEPDP